jgi:MFS family permease
VHVFRGWIVVAATHACLFVVFGVAYSFAAFFEALEREFAANRGDVAAVFAICGFLYFLVGAFAGQLADRFGPRRVVLAGIGFLALGLAAASRADSLAALYVTYSVGIGLGVGCVYVPAVGAVQPWFIARRGLASGLAVAGIGVGNFVVPLVAIELVGAFGWRRSFEILAGAALVLGGAAALLIENRPQARGLYPDGARADAGAAPPAQVAAGIALADALRTRAFWLQWGAIFACSIGLFMPFVHLVPYARDAGHAETTAVLLVSLIGVGSMIGRFALGGLADRIERRALHAVLYAGMAAMLGLWLTSTGAVALGVFAIAFGTFYGAFVALQPPLAMDLFGGRNVAGVIGVLYTAAGVGNLLGPWLAGVAYDLTRSYAVPIVASIVLMLAAVALALALRRVPVT